MNGSKINLHFFCADSTLGPGRRGAKSVIFFYRDLYETGCNLNGSPSKTVIFSYRFEKSIIGLLKKMCDIYTVYQLLMKAGDIFFS